MYIRLARKLVDEVSQMGYVKGQVHVYKTQKAELPDDINYQYVPEPTEE